MLLGPAWAFAKNIQLKHHWQVMGNKCLFIDTYTKFFTPTPRVCVYTGLKMSASTIDQWLRLGCSSIGTQEVCINYCVVEGEECQRPYGWAAQKHMAQPPLLGRKQTGSGGVTEASLQEMSLGKVHLFKLCDKWNSWTLGRQAGWLNKSYSLWPGGAVLLTVRFPHDFKTNEIAYGSNTLQNPAIWPIAVPALGVLIK